MTFINYICALAVRMSVFWFFLQFVSLFVCVAAGLFVSYCCFEEPFNLIYIYYNIEIYVVYAYSHSIIVYTHLCKLFTPQTILKTNHSKFNEVSSKSFIIYCFFFFYFSSSFIHVLPIGTVCSRSPDLNYMVTYYIKWVKTYWTYSTT